MKLSKTGTNIQAFEQIFRDGKGSIFRFALSESFSFASQVIRIANEARPKHGLELWDQAVQYKLAKLNQQQYPFIDNTTCILEKQDSTQVWQYGFTITTLSGKNQRLWTLPEGIIKTPREVIALEFDHGITIGRWANQLVKAVRSLASKQIDGALYCFCMEKNLNESGCLFTEQEPFSEEFLALLRANMFEKKLGIITLFPTEWRGENLYERNDFIDFFESMYIDKKAGLKSRLGAQEILSQL